MELQVLGCSGGIGEGLRTTTFLLDDDALIDAGTGVGDLKLHEMVKLRHIFLTHSHLDHIAGIPLLVDTVFGAHGEPIVIHAQEVTINALRAHIFNNIIWPDFSLLPNKDKPAIRYQTMVPGEIYQLGDRRIEMITVNHIVPGVAYRVETSTGVFAFSGDTSTTDHFWQRLNGYDKLDLLFVESAFANKDQHLSKLAGHYCPETLAADLKKLKHSPVMYLSHAKPGDEELIYNECQQAISTHQVNSLKGKMHFTV
jgi:ribonuclease BN (tRNA processing enzyme)